MSWDGCGMSYALDRLSQLEEEGEAPSQVAPGRQTLTSRLAPRPLDQRPRDSGEASDRLPAPVQSQMGAAFGLHLGGVSVERDSTFATSVGAEAVAHDGRLHFAPGMYDPGSTSGLSLIGHEVAHLAQQTDGRATQAQAKGEGESPELEAEAEALGSRAAAGEVGLLGDGTLRTPARSSAVQRRPTKWAQIQENGVGVMWDPHKTRAPGNRNQAGTATGTGASLDAPPPTITYRPVHMSGSGGVDAMGLGAHGRPGPGAAPYNAAHYFLTGNYQNIRVLPTALGGVDDERNVVALPQSASNELDHAHARMLALAQDTLLDFHVGITEKNDPTAKVWFASHLDVRWAQRKDDGTEAPGSVGHYTIDVPSPTDLGNGVTAQSTSVDLGLGVANQVLSPAAVAADAARNTLTTRIDFKEATGDGDGQRMTAHALGPDHGIGQQPGDTGVWKTRTKAMHTASSNTMKYVAGHLLNHHLGGPGNDARNLTPIPDDVNHEHEATVESHVKRLVNELGYWVYYDVEVKFGTELSGLQYPNEMICTWGQLDSAGMVIPSTWNQVQLPISPPSQYAVTPIDPDKKLPNLADHNVLLANADAHNPIGVHTTLGFDEVLLDETLTLGHQFKVMQPLIASLTQLGLNTHFQTNGALAQDVFRAMAAVKPTAAECDARAEVERLTQELRDLAVADDARGVKATIDELRIALRDFTGEVEHRAAATDEVAAGALATTYGNTRAAEFAQLLRQASAQARRELRLTAGAAFGVMDAAERLARERDALTREFERYAAPPTPNQALGIDLDEAEFNDEEYPQARSGHEAMQSMAKRRAVNPSGTFFGAQPSQQIGDQLLGTIRDLNDTGELWPFVAGSGLSPGAQQVGQAIQGLVGGLPGTGGALEMVVRSLYASNTFAVNEYAAWLRERLAVARDDAQRREFEEYEAQQNGNVSDDVDYSELLQQEDEEQPQPQRTADDMDAQPNGPIHNGPPSPFPFGGSIGSPAPYTGQPGSPFPFGLMPSSSQPFDTNYLGGYGGGGYGGGFGGGGLFDDDDF